MLKRIDRYVVARHSKNQHSKLYRFFSTTPGFIITTLVALCQNINEIFDNWHEAHYVLTSIFFGIALLLLFFLFRHTIWHRRIEHFEYRLKIVEAALIWYIGFDRCHHFTALEGLSFRVIMLVICTMGLVGLYCYQSRVLYLKKINVISDMHKKPV